MPKLKATPTKSRRVKCYLHSRSKEELYVEPAAPGSSPLRAAILQSLPPTIPPANVAIYTQGPTASMTADVFVSRAAAEEKTQTQSTQSQLDSLSMSMQVMQTQLSEVLESNRLITVSNDALRKRLERSTNTANQSTGDEERLLALESQVTDLNAKVLKLEGDLKHKTHEDQAKAMIGLLGYLARNYSNTKLHDPATGYAAQVMQQLSNPSRNNKLYTNFERRPLFKATLTKSVVTKLDAAAQVEVRDANAHLENDTVMLLSVLLAVEEDWVNGHGEDQAGSEPAEHVAVRTLLSELGPEQALGHLAQIQAQPVKYGTVPHSQLTRLAAFVTIT